MIRDPLAEVLEVAVRTPDDTEPGAVDPHDAATLRLARRRFGVALPPPFVAVPAEPARLPIRPSVLGDGPAVAAVQRRAWRAHYRGLLSDEFLDGLDLGYLGGYWTGRTAVPPSPRHRLLIAGPTGEVHGMVDTGPARDEDLDEAVGEVRSLYLDPSVVGRGLGRALLGAACDALVRSGFTEAVLWVVVGNGPARSFYEEAGWVVEGAERATPVADERVDEIRYRLPRGL